MRKQLLKAALLGGLMTASFFSSFGQVPPNDNCGTVLTFDGTDDYVTMGDAPALNFSITDSFSVEAWFKTTKNLTILSKAGGASPYKGYQLLVVSNGSVAFGLTNSFTANNDIEVRSTTLGLKDDKWHHVVCTYDGMSDAQGITMFIDGVKETNNVTSNTLTLDFSNNFPFQIGSRGGSRLNSGSIDGVSVWNKVLTEAEAVSHYTSSPTVTDQGLVALYDFNEGSGSDTLYDHVNNQNNGVLVNMDLLAVWTKADGSSGGRSKSFVDISACDSYISPSGKTVWTKSGIYVDVVENVYGCDSVITIGLEIVSSPSNDITINGTDLTSDAVRVDYLWIDCKNNGVDLGATGQTFTPTEPGNYAVIVSNEVCVDTSECVEGIVTGGFDNFGNSNVIEIHPNPTSQTSVLQLGKTYENISVNIVDMKGTTVFSSSYSSRDQIELDFEGKSGMYFVTLQSGNEMIGHLKLIKE